MDGMAKKVLIHDDGIVDSGKMGRTVLFVVICAVISIGMILLGVGAIAYEVLV